MLTELAYSLRLSILAQFRDASPDAAVAETARNEMDKIALLARLQNEHAEGVVFKSLAARYTPGRQPTQVKCKFWESATFIVKTVNQGVRSVELGLLDTDGATVRGWGNCTVHSNYPVPAVGALVEVKYLYVDDNVYQPQYLGERSDIERSACVASQLKFKPGSRHLVPALVSERF
jgi:bifunctional non-homologous end joining protein LigD